MGWLIALVVLGGLLVLPIGFSAIYRESNPGVWILIGPVKFRVYPGKPKEKKESPKEVRKHSASTKSESKKGGSYRDFQPVVGTIIEFLGEFRRKIRVNNLILNIVLAGDDPANLAVNYGRAWAALGNLMPQLERLFVIRKRDLEVACDFTADKTRIFARLDATITLGRTLHLLSRHGLKVLKHLMKLKKLRKGGAQL